MAPWPDKINLPATSHEIGSRRRQGLGRNCGRQHCARGIWAASSLRWRRRSRML